MNSLFQHENANEIRIKNFSNWFVYFLVDLQANIKKKF